MRGCRNTYLGGGGVSQVREANGQQVGGEEGPQVADPGGEVVGVREAEHRHELQGKGIGKSGTYGSFGTQAMSRSGIDTEFSYSLNAPSSTFVEWGIAFDTGL